MNIPNHIVYIYIYIYIYILFVGPKRERNSLKWVCPQRDLYFLGFIYLFILFSHTCMFPPYCFCLRTYVVHSISFQTFFVQAFEIVIDSWNFSMLLLYILWDDWPIFRISGLNQQLQQQLEYILLKPDCHSWWISKMQSGREDTLEEWYQ